MRRRFLPTASSKLSNHDLLVERIVAEREEDDVVVRVQAGVRTSRSSGRRHPASPRNSAGCAREQIERHVFILQTDPGATEIALVDVLPEADREFLNALHVGCAERAGAVEADRIRGTRNQYPACI